MTPEANIEVITDNNKNLILIDGSFLVHRSYHAFKDNPLSIKNTGEETSAVYGFLNTFLNAYNTYKPTNIAVTFDLPKPTFRHLKYKEYKANRPPTPESLINQFTRVRQLMSSFNVPIYEMEGYEADDVLGTLCKQAENYNIDTIILTGDTDILQLVSPRVKVLLNYGTRRQKIYDETAVKERYGGLGPETIPDIKAMEGDQSDNIPGVPGIGIKTATRLLNQFRSIEGIFENIEEVIPTRFQKVLRENHERVQLAKWLTTISREVPVTLDLKNSYFLDYKRTAVIDLLRELEFSSMTSRIPEPLNLHATEKESEYSKLAAGNLTEYILVDNKSSLNAMISELSESKVIALDTETTSTDPLTAELVGVSFSTKTGKAWYIPLGHNKGKQIQMNPALQELRRLLCREDIVKVAHNLNYDMSVFKNYDVDLGSSIFDTMLAAHLTGRRNIGLKALAIEFFGEEMTPIKALIGSGKTQITMKEVEIDKALPYAAADADFTLRLYHLLKKEIQDKRLNRVFHEVEMPLIPVLVEMQLNGVALDPEVLPPMSVELGSHLDKIKTNVFNLLGHEFNLNSPVQLSEVLFEYLKLPGTKRTKTGFSTDAASLESLKDRLRHGKIPDADIRALAILDDVLTYRQLSKLKSTYVDSLPKLVNNKTRRIHTSYNQTGSSTGRVSSNDPNIQNIPVRTSLGNKVRTAFVAEKAPNQILLSADYSQIELRILAHFSQDPSLIKAFHNHEDIHSSTAASVYGVPINKVTDDMRRISKIMNFGVLYGLSAYGIEQQTGLSRKEGSEFIETYFGKYPRVRTYIDSTKEIVRSRGFVETLLGRRRYINEVKSSNYAVRAAGERMAINMPIQGTAADIIKIAMINIQHRIDDLEFRSKMIIQVHDELIFEVPENELEQLKLILLDLMPSAMALAVPLEADLKTGYNWGNMS